MKYFASILLGLTLATSASAQETVRMMVDNNDPRLTINRNIYGHFSEHLGRCIYDGFWVKDSMNVPKQDRIRLDIVDALRKIRIPNLRWPGGCFADEYHWRDGIGPRKERPTMINTNWGNVTEDNSFGTHEFLELCGLLNCEPYITGNVGSGTVQEMSKWIEYLNFDGLSPLTTQRRENGHPAPFNVHFWGVGNESWGCGGNMTPEYYSNEYRRYATFAKNYPNARLKLIAGGANSFDYNWTDVVMKNISGMRPWGISLHYYTIARDWNHKGSATTFDESDYMAAMKSCLRMDELVSKHSTIMDRYDPEKKTALVVDEWGIWTDVEPGTNPAFLFQQNSMRDAIIAASTLNIFNNHCDRVRVANLAQTINVLQALILTQGPEMLLTPTYHVFDLYQVHQDARLLPVQFTSPQYKFGNDAIAAVNASASMDSSGRIHISLVNTDPHRDIIVRTSFVEGNWNSVTGKILTSEHFNDVNTFGNKDHVRPVAFNGARREGKNLEVKLPRLSVVMLELK